MNFLNGAENMSPGQKARAGVFEEKNLKVSFHISTLWANAMEINLQTWKRAKPLCS